MKAVPRRSKLVAAALWSGLLLAGLAWGWSNGLGVGEMLAAGYLVLAHQPLAAVLYIGLYALRSFTFFPAMWLTIAAGSLFGFWFGIVVAFVGENLSAIIAYVVARFFGSRSPTGQAAVAKLSAFRRTLHEHAFPTVLTLRATYLPFDLVNYGCGLLRVRWWPYLFGSLIGMLPPMLTFVSFGATVNFAALATNFEDFDPAALLDFTQLLISLGLLLASALIVWAAERHRRKLQRQSNPAAD